MAADFAVEIEGNELAVEAEFEPVAVRGRFDPAHVLVIAAVGAIELVWLALVALFVIWAWSSAPW